MPVVSARTLECQHVQRFFHDAQDAPVPLGVGTDITHNLSGDGDVEAFFTEAGGAFQVGDGIRQLTAQFFRRAQQVKCQP